MAGRTQSPLLGYNTNVKHRGRVFHIQTEDSGVAHPHVITHVFADGGRILKSQKTSYAELLEAPDLQVQVKRIMQDQHKALFIALRDGQFDHLVDPDVSSRTAAVSPPPELDTADLSAQWKGQPEPAAVAQPAAVPTPSMGSMPAQIPQPPAAPVSVPDASIARAASSVRGPVSSPSVMLPRVPTASGRGAPTPSMPDALARTGSSGSAAAGASRAGRYAPVRAPETLGSFKSKPGEGASIFGDGMMSEKSLDEVILAYLAEDLDDGKKR